MSLKSQLRRLDAGVRWLETEGRHRRVATMMKTLERMQEIADRVASDPAFAVRWKKDFSYIPLPPPTVTAPPVVVPLPPPPLLPPPPPAASVVRVEVPSMNKETGAAWWRARGPQDYFDDGRTSGTCLTDYEVLRDEDDD